MPGERWPDKRARAVLFAGANKLVRDGAELDADAVADLSLEVRDLLFLHHEVREEVADRTANRIGFSADCMQFATLEADHRGPLLGLWVGTEHTEAAKRDLDAEDDPNPFRKMYGWVRVPVAAATELKAVDGWVHHAFEHAMRTKAAQDGADPAKKAL